MRTNKLAMLAASIAFVTGCAVGGAFMFFYKLDEASHLTTKYAECVVDINKLSIRYSKLIVEGIKEQSESTEQVLRCRERLMSTIKELTPKEKPPKKKKRKGVSRKRKK